ncbi:MAG: M14 family zinc carboxypeptidase [Spirochaetia bacterium]|jgi:hypothetical protein
MEITTEFECGNGKSIREISENQFVIETEGSDPLYSFYFYFKVKGDTRPRNVTITIFPDSTYAKDNPDLFNDDRPSVLWIKKDKFGWTRMNHHWAFQDRESFRVEKSRYHIRLHVDPLSEIEVSNMLPLPYSEMCSWLRTTCGRRPDLLQLVEVGKSEQDRAILGMLLCARDTRPGERGKKKLLVYAGEHAAEFAGQWAVKGMIEFALSSVSEAKNLRKNYEILFIPQVNPDGNVLGRLHNINGINLHLDFGLEEGQCRPKTREAKALWELANSFKPDMCLCLHTFIGPLLSSDPPYEGIYVPPSACFLAEEAMKRQELANDHFCWNTDVSYFWGRDELLKKTDANTVLYRLASDLGTVGCVFEPNMSLGEIGCVRSALKVLQALISPFEIG